MPRCRCRDSFLALWSVCTSRSGHQRVFASISSRSWYPKDGRSRIRRCCPDIRKRTTERRANHHSQGYKHVFGCWIGTPRSYVDGSLRSCPAEVASVASNWKDPEDFKPDRFIDTEEYKWPRDAFIPFSGGVRVCTGQNFARIELVCKLVACELPHSQY